MKDAGEMTSLLLNGSGGARELDLQGLRDWQADQGLLWVHLHSNDVFAQQWMEQESELDPIVVEALMAESTRPRCVPIGDGVLLILRGVNCNQGADPEDMVSIRVWVEASRIITVRRRHLFSVDDLRAHLLRGDGPSRPGEFIVALADQLLTRMVDVISNTDDAVDRLQGEVLSAGNLGLRTELTELRHDIIALRRYLAPQREALARLSQIKLSWLSEGTYLALREQADQVTRIVEDLDAARERAAVTQEELTNQLSEQLNSRMYVLSIVAAIFLPLGFLTGLFGINVGGIPLAENPWGFISISLAMLTIVVLQIAVFRMRRWL